MHEYGDVREPRRTKQSLAPGRRRDAIVGLGSRHGMYRAAILGAHAPHAELVGMCDINPRRVALSQKVADLVTGFARRDYPPMPAHDIPVPMPPRR